MVPFFIDRYNWSTNDKIYRNNNIFQISFSCEQFPCFLLLDSQIFIKILNIYAMTLYPYNCQNIEDIIIFILNIYIRLYYKYNHF